MYDALKKFFSKKQTLRNLIALAGSTALSQALSVATLPVLSRLYDPSDLGLFGIFSSFVGIFSVISSFSYEVAIVSAKDDSEAASLTYLSLIISAFFVVFSSVAAYLMVVNNFLGFEGFDFIAIPLLGIAVLLTSTLKILKYFLIRESDFLTVSKTTVVQSLARSFTQIIFGLQGLASLGLLISDVLGRLAGMGKMLNRSFPALWPLKSSAKVAALQSVAWKYLKFPMLSLPSSLLDSLALSLVVPLITQTYGADIGGYFVLSQRVLAVPLSLIGNSVADVFHTTMSSYAHTSSGQAKAFFLKTARRLFLLGLLPAIAFTFLSPQIFRLIFGEQWEIAGFFCSVMAPWNLAALIVSPLSRVVFIFQGQEWKLGYDVFALISVFSVIYGGKISGLLPLQTISLLSILNICAYVAYFLILLKIIERSSYSES